MGAPDSSPTKQSPGYGFGGLRIGKFRFSAVELLVALVVLFFATPFVEDLRYGSSIETGLITLVFIFAVLAVGGKRISLVVTALLVIPALTLRWVHHLAPATVSRTPFLIFGILFALYVIGYLLRYIFRASVVDRDVLCAGIANLLMLGLLWAFIYTLLGAINPHSFSFNATAPDEQEMSGFNAFYFSFATISTAGFGDITPVSKVARMLAVMEAMTGVLYVAVLVSRLVSLYTVPAVEPPSNSQGD